MYSLLVSAPVEQEFGGFLEAEDDKAEEEDEERDRAQHDQSVPPSHVAFFRAARLSLFHIVARWQLLAVRAIPAREFREEAVGDGAGKDHAKRLEDRQDREQEPLLLG